MSKGPYRASEGFSGSRAMSRSQGKLKSAQGKMSSAHGVVTPSKDNNMNQGGRGIFGDCKMGMGKEAGPKNFGHAKQLKGD